MDLDLRKLRYFMAVADELHFGRAAERLFIAQPVLSRQIRSLEQELGCPLLTRTSRTVALTAAGERLHEEARHVFALVDSAVRRVHEAERGYERLVVAFATGLRVSEAARGFSQRHPDVALEFLPLLWWEQEAPLRDGRAQVGFLRRPFDDTGLRTIPIGLEHRVVCLPAGHPLARKRVVKLADLDGETLMNAHARRTATIEEKFELIAAGQGVALVPLTVARSYSRPELVYRRVSDIVPSETCLAVLVDQHEPLVQDFLDVAEEILAAKPALTVAR
jgi:DNA-binding transcriptional LysR family regulator